MKVRRLGVATVALTLLFLAGASRANAPAGRYTMASGTVYDTKTKLTWQQTAAPGAGYTWGSAGASGTAQSYCATLSLNGPGWRLPTIKELYTLVDFSQAQGTALIDSTYFPGAPASTFWSATPVSGSPGSAWDVNFFHGNASNYGVSNAFDVRCVR